MGWLDLMDRPRRTGMSIRQMREYTVLVMRGATTPKERREMLRAHRKRVEAMVEDLELSLQLIDDKIEFYGQ